MTQVAGGKIGFDSGDYLGSVNTTPLAPHLMFAIQLLGADVSEIFSYKIVSVGKMQQVSSTGPPMPGEQLLGMAFHPTQHVMYVGIPSANEIAVYTYNPQGVLTLVTTVPNMGQEPCWFAENSAGTRLYSVESKGGTVSVYDTTTATAPVQLAHLTLSNQPQSATEVAIDPTGNFLYVLGVPTANEMGSPYLHVFSITAGTPYLAELNPVLLNVPPLEHPQGVATLLK
jgi:6-phosphogluconolactonase (cycloisomerase 2 family)